MLRGAALFGLGDEGAEALGIQVRHGFGGGDVAHHELSRRDGAPGRRRRTGWPSWLDWPLPLLMLALICSSVVMAISP